MSTTATETKATAQAQPKAAAKPRQQRNVQPKAEAKPAPAKKAAPKSAKERVATVAKSQPTQLHKDFIAWLQANGVTGVGSEKDLKLVQLAFNLRHDFQRSAENQAGLAARKAQASAKAEERAAKAVEHLTKQLAQAKAKAGKLSKAQAK